MYYKFKTVNEYNSAKILNEMSQLISNKTDLPTHHVHVKNMIQFVLTRKHEDIFMAVTTKNVAKYLVSFIPTTSVGELKRLASLNDPVCLVIIVLMNLGK